MKVLIADDMKTMRKILMHVLHDLGFENLVEAEDGQKAWEVMEREASGKDPVLLVVSDWNMPHLKGIDLLRKTRKDPRFKSVKFVMVTAESEKSSAKEANAPDARVDGFLEKPFQPQDVQNVLEKIGISAKKRAA